MARNGKASGTEAGEQLRIWYPARAACGPDLSAWPVPPVRLQRPQEAGHGPALLLYQAPERHLCQALEQGQAPAVALAAWAADAREILQAGETGAPHVRIAELERFLHAPRAFTAALGVATPADAAISAGPHVAEDSLLALLAACCARQDSEVQALAASLAGAALSPVPGPASETFGEQACAAAEACLALRARQGEADSARQQIALLLEQKHLMQAELETLQRLNTDLTQALQKRLDGKEMALQAAGRSLHTLSTWASTLQARLAESEARLADSRASASALQQEITAIHNSRTYRLMAPLRRLQAARQGRT